MESSDATVCVEGDTDANLATIPSPTDSSIQGGIPSQSHNTIINFPDGEAATNKENNKKVAPIQQRKLPSQLHHKVASHSIDLVVYFCDKTGLHLTVEDGQHMEAGELFEVVMDEMQLPAQCREVFSLWLVSDLLELQLKPNHVPFKLVCYWEELLEKYTTVDQDDRERDEPVIQFQRNVFFPKWCEKKVVDQGILKLLYHEAKERVIDGRYPLKSEQYDFLAGLQAQLKQKNFDHQLHTPEFYRDKLREYYPERKAQTRWKLPGLLRNHDSPEFRLVKSHSQFHQQFGSIKNDKDTNELYLKYLNVCWDLPYYGAAFFRGQIEHPGGGMRLLSLQDDPVWIAVNTEGVFILDMDTIEFLIGLPYQKLSWEYGEPQDKENRDCLPCLFLSFPSEEKNKPVTKMLQIFSKEAVLTDALIEACIGLKQLEKEKRTPSDIQNDILSVLQATGETWQRLSRLCLATFTRKGVVIDNPARVPKPNY